MNLPITAEAEQAFFNTAKTSKVVNKAKKLPYWTIFVVKGESIDVACRDPEYSEEITADNFQSLVWEPLVEKIVTEYAKNACLAAVDIVFKNKDGTELNEPIFFKWCPDSGVPVRTKMLIGSSFQSAKKKLDVQGTTPEVTMASELNFAKFTEAAKIKF